MFKKTITQLFILIIVIGAVFLANGLILAWSPPPGSPPDPNAPAPINVSPIIQTFLDSKILSFTDPNTDALLIDGGFGVNKIFRSYSSAIFNSNVQFSNFASCDSLGTDASGNLTCSGGEAPCVDTTWSPDQSTVCSGEPFTQTSNCLNTRSSTGTKDCTPACTPSSACAATTCTDSTCTDSCENVYTGTKDCTPPPPYCPVGTIQGAYSSSLGSTPSNMTAQEVADAKTACSATCAQNFVPDNVYVICTGDSWIFSSCTCWCPSCD